MTDEERKALNAKRAREHYNQHKAAINARRRELYALMAEQEPDRHSARKAQMQEHAQAMRDAANEVQP